MTLLTRYLIRQNIFLIVSILLIATGIYLLTDLFERLDNFLDAGLGFVAIGTYFLVKIPMIKSQLFPAVFLIAFVVQFNLLSRSKELVALYAGGISPTFFIRFVLIYGLLWGCGQFVFSEVAGIEGDRIALEMWKGEVRGANRADLRIENLSFIDKNRIIHIGEVFPERKVGKSLIVYVLDEQGLLIEEVIKAETFTVQEKKWELLGVTRVIVDRYLVEHQQELDFLIRQDLRAFQLVETWTKPEQLPLWELGKMLKRLQKAGSNVEALQTVWHAKLSYAVSVVVMGLLALAISQKFQNIYQAVGLALLCIFIIYALNTFCISLGKGGAISPIIAAWLTNVGALVCLAVYFGTPALLSMSRRPSRVSQ